MASGSPLPLFGVGVGGGTGAGAGDWGCRSALPLELVLSLQRLLPLKMRRSVVFTVVKERRIVVFRTPVSSPGSIALKSSYDGTCFHTPSSGAAAAFTSSSGCPFLGICRDGDAMAA
jgi:hypothetical protein